MTTKCVYMGVLIHCGPVLRKSLVVMSDRPDSYASRGGQGQGKRVEDINFEESRRKSIFSRPVRRFRFYRRRVFKAVFLVLVFDLRNDVQKVHCAIATARWRYMEPQLRGGSSSQMRTFMLSRCIFSDTDLCVARFECSSTMLAAKWVADFTGENVYL